MMDNTNLFEKNPFFDKKCKVKDFLELLMCQNSERTDECFFGTCKKCQEIDVDQLRESLHDFFIDQDIFEIEFNSWITTDRANLEKRKLSTEDFTEELFERLKKLQIHAYIACCQSQSYQDAKDSVREGEFVIAMDFAENYSFIVEVCIFGRIGIS